MSIIYTKFNQCVQSARIQHRIQTHYFSMCTRVLKSYNIKIKNLATRILHITKPVKIKLPGSASSQQEPHCALNDCQASLAGKRCPSRCSWEQKRVIHLEAIRILCRSKDPFYPVDEYSLQTCGKDSTLSQLSICESQASCIFEWVSTVTLGMWWSGSPSDWVCGDGGPVTRVVILVILIVWSMPTPPVISVLRHIYRNSQFW